MQTIKLRPMGEKPERTDGIFLINNKSNWFDFWFDFAYYYNEHKNVRRIHTYDTCEPWENFKTYNGWCYANELEFIVEGAK